jgi:hypothetical protein
LGRSAAKTAELASIVGKHWQSLAIVVMAIAIVITSMATCNTFITTTIDADDVGGGSTNIINKRQQRQEHHRFSQ